MRAEVLPWDVGAVLHSFMRVPLQIPLGETNKL